MEAGTPAGYTYLKCDSKPRLLFFITRQATCLILWTGACEKLGLVRHIRAVKVKSPATKDDLVKQFPEVTEA